VNQNTRDEFIKTLHRIKPKTTSKVKKGGRHGGVLNPTVVNGLEKLQFTTKLKNFSMNPPQNDREAIEECCTDSTHSHLKDIGEDADVPMIDTSLPNGSSYEKLNYSPMVRRPRMSAAERRRLKKNPGNACDAAARSLDTRICDKRTMNSEKQAQVMFDVFDWKAKAINSGKPLFFLDTEKPPDEENKILRETHLKINPRKNEITYNAISQMNAASMDLVPEDHTERRHKTKLARR
jgi:hypothetical protein